MTRSTGRLRQLVPLVIVAGLAMAGCDSTSAPTPTSGGATTGSTTCPVTWLYTPSSSMASLVTSLANGQDQLTNTAIDGQPISPCEKAVWLAGSAAGGDCQGTVCLGINDTAHGPYDRGLEGLESLFPVESVAPASVVCAIQMHGPPWDGPELVVNGPDGSCRTLQVYLSSLAVWDTVVPAEVVTSFQGGATPVHLCAGQWNGLAIDVYFSSNPNVFHGDYGTQVCAALSLPGL